jgi:hydroxyacylglutathione hydrolase
MNRTGASGLNELPSPQALDPRKVNELAKLGRVILDVRPAGNFGAGHIPGSLNIGLGGQFAAWAGTLITPDSLVLIVADTQEQVDEAVMRLARVGIETVEGYLSGGIPAWLTAGFPIEIVPQISVDELHNLVGRQTALQVIDVRRLVEFKSGHVPRAIAAPLTNLKAIIPALGLNPGRRTAVICAGGYRSSAATGILQQQGFQDVLNVVGGTSAWINAGYPVEIPPVD